MGKKAAIPPGRPGRKKRAEEIKLRALKGSRGFTRSQMGGPAAHDEGVERARRAAAILERQGRAYTLFVDGRLSYEQIAAREKVSVATAWNDVQAMWARMQDRAADDGELRRHRQGLNLDALHQTHYPIAKGTAKGRAATPAQRADSARILLDIYRQEARLFGLDQRRDKVFTEAEVRGMLGQVVQMFLGLDPAAEMRRAFALGLRRLRAAPAIDVAPEKVGETV